MRLRQASWRGFTLALAALPACAADERPLSFEVGVLGSAGVAAATGSDAGNAGDGVAGQVPTAGGAADAGAGGDEAAGSTGQGTAGEESSRGGSGSPGGGVSSGGGAGGGSDTGSAGVTFGGAGAGGSSSGSAGMAGTGGEPFLSPCGDLNDNRVDDCEETIVKNSRFDTALAEWSPDGPLLAQHWQATDARSQSGSGSLSILNSNVVAGGTGNTTLGSGQCLVAWGNQQFEVGARAFIKAAQGGGRASVNLLTFGHDGCQGVLLEGITIDSAADTGSWQVLNGSVKLPAATRSVLVRLVATKPFAQASLEVLFDDVLMREK